MLSSCSFLDLEKASSDSSREIASTGTPDTQVLETRKRSSQDSSKLALRKRILVLPFRNESSVGGQEISQFAAEEVRNKLDSVDEFIVVRDQDVPGVSLLNTPANESDLVPLIEAFIVLQ
jgi:hypothetical protein